jgi:glycosyltransferase involved in cell wall biosynthesis
MNILIIHNTYQQAGGEDVVVEQETRLLEKHGHRVIAYRRSNHELENLSFGDRLGLVGRMISAADSNDAVRSILRNHKADLVHVHNTFAMVSPSVYKVCQEEGVPVVQTLHNYRLLCPAATLYRDGKICEECITHNLLHSVRYGCYRHSRAMTGAIALMLKTHRLRHTWDRQVDAYIVLSNFARDRFIQAGIPGERICVKPNFVEPDPRKRSRPGKYALFVGRLSQEKGVLTLLEAWKKLPAAIPLVIVGDGPMRSFLEEEIKSNRSQDIRLTGWLKREQVHKAMKEAAFLVVPSVWSEPFGLTIAEAFACGTPVLGARIGAIPEMVDDQVTGLHFVAGDGDALAITVTWAWEHPSELAAMGSAGRQVYEDRYTAEANYAVLMDIYNSVIDAYAKRKERWLSRNAS